MRFEESLLRRLIKDLIKEVHYFGLKKISKNDLGNQCPLFWDFLQTNYGDFVDSDKCIFACRRRDEFSQPIFYAVFPDEHRTLVAWEKDRSSFSRSEDLTRAIEQLK